jgi:hypothetical protein
MSADPIGTRPPTRVFQTDRIHYRVATDYHAADGWALKVAFVTHDQAGISGTLQTILTTSNAVTEVAGSPGTWDVDLDSSGGTAPSTQAWQVGLYSWREWVEKAGAVDRINLRRGTMLLEQAYDSGALASTGKDLRSWARAALEAVEAVLIKKAAKDQLEYQIAGRQLQHYTHDEMLRFRAYLRSEVDREDRIEAIETMGHEDSGTILVEF